MNISPNMREIRYKKQNRLVFKRLFFPEVYSIRDTSSNPNRREWWKIHRPYRISLITEEIARSRPIGYKRFLWSRAVITPFPGLVRHLFPRLAETPNGALNSRPPSYFRFVRPKIMLRASYVREQDMIMVRDISRFISTDTWINDTSGVT